MASGQTIARPTNPTQHLVPEKMLGGFENGNDAGPQLAFDDAYAERVREFSDFLEDNMVGTEFAPRRIPEPDWLRPDSHISHSIRMTLSTMLYLRAGFASHRVLWRLGRRAHRERASIVKRSRRCWPTTETDSSLASTSYGSRSGRFATGGLRGRPFP